MKNTDVKKPSVKSSKRKISKKNQVVNKKKVNTKKNIKKGFKKSLVIGNKIKGFTTNMFKGSSKTIVANIPQSIIYILVYLFACVSTIMFSVLFWNTNVEIDTKSWIGVNIDKLLNDINGLIMAIMIIAIELYKINDSLTVLRLRKNTDNYKSVLSLNNVFLIMSIIASVSYLVINKSGLVEVKPDTAPIEQMVYTIFYLIRNFDIELISVIFLSSIYAVLIEVTIKTIPKRLKLIWYGDTGVVSSKKSINLKNIFKKYIRISKEFISNKKRVSDNNNLDNNNKNIKNDEKPIVESDLDINKNDNVEDKDISSNSKVIEMNKKIKSNVSGDIKKKSKNNIDISIVNKVIEYLEKVKNEKKVDEFKINVENVKMNCVIDHNKWQVIRDELVDKGYVIQVSKRAFKYVGNVRGKRVKNY